MEMPEYIGQAEDKGCAAIREQKETEKERKKERKTERTGESE